MKRAFTASVWQEGDWYVAQCLEIDVASQGHTEQEALENLNEAIALYLEPIPSIQSLSIERDSSLRSE